MKSVTLPLLILMATATTASSEALYWDEDAVKGLCTTEWGTDYEMIAYCIDTNKTGFEDYSAAKEIVETSADIFLPSFSKCEREWGIQWEMVAYCADSQVKALGELLNTLQELPEDVGATIQTRCAAEWNPDITMIAYCAENQAAGWHSIND